MGDTLQWVTWGREWERWSVETQFDLDEVKRLGRPARHDKGNGAGAWYEYVPERRGPHGMIFLLGPDGTCQGEAFDAPGVRWHHLRGCDCERCAPSASSEVAW